VLVLAAIAVLLTRRVKRCGWRGALKASGVDGLPG
jgi:hypothetical protein